MSQANVKIVLDSYQQFAVTGQVDPEIAAPDFVWDMSNFHGWPEQQLYTGIEGAQTFQDEWRSAWDDWELDVEQWHDAGDKVVVLMRQRGRSKAAGILIDMYFAMVWTLRDGKETRMEMYSEPSEALEAVGLGHVIAPPGP